MMTEVFIVAYAVIGESALPDFFCATDHRSEGMRVSTLDQLDVVFERDVVGGSEEQMDVFGHDDERMQLIAVFATVAVQSL